MRSKAEEYRHNALKCLNAAEASSDLSTRAQLLGMAQAWHNLADQAEKNNQTDLVYQTPEHQQHVAQQQQQIQPDQEQEKDERSKKSE